jgi:hypothetical protein
MGDEIIGIFAEIRIEATNEVAAWALAAALSITPCHCRWSPHRSRLGGVLYIGAQMYIDGRHNQFTFHEPPK